MAEALCVVSETLFGSCGAECGRVLREGRGAASGWNLQVPIINVSAWTRLIREDERRFNWNLVRALAKAFGKAIPRKLPERKPVTLDSKNANREDDLFGSTGS